MASRPYDLFFEKKSLIKCNMRYAYMICDVICICRRAPGGLCCLREPSQSTNLSNMEIHLALILHFPYELKLFVQFLLFIVVMS